MNEIILFCKVSLIIIMLRRISTQKECSFEDYFELVIMVGDVIHDISSML